MSPMKIWWYINGWVLWEVLKGYLISKSSTSIKINFSSFIKIIFAFIFASHFYSSSASYCCFLLCPLNFIFFLPTKLCWLCHCCYCWSFFPISMIDVYKRKGLSFAIYFLQYPIKENKNNGTELFLGLLKTIKEISKSWGDANTCFV